MNSMVILDRQPASGIAAFVDFWKQQYSFPNMYLYTQNIDSHQLTAQQLQALFRWKSGMNLSRQKQKTVEAICHQVPLINQCKTNGIAEESFAKAFGSLPAIWNIYLRHIIQPATYPIFDQHVYRASCFLQTGAPANLPTNQRKKEEAYHQAYRPFFQHWSQHLSQPGAKKELDKALWAFGKFLTTYPKMLL